MKLQQASPPLSESLQGMLDNAQPTMDWQGGAITTNNVMYANSAGTTTAYNASEALADLPIDVD